MGCQIGEYVGGNANNKDTGQDHRPRPQAHQHIARHKRAQHGSEPSIDHDQADFQHGKFENTLHHRWEQCHIAEKDGVDKKVDHQPKTKFPAL